jgi:hypothetical protein
MEAQPNKVNIYGIKNGENFHYIGKTVRTANEGMLKNSDVHYRYTNDKINDLFTDNTNVTVIKVVDEDVWYSEKLHEVVEFYNKQHPLVNAKWMCESKRGYWEGKVKDKYTITRLSESKFKKVYQYDSRGYLFKIWRSGKAAATMVFKDYSIVKGSACSELYSILRSKGLKNKFRHDYYWFREEDLKARFAPNEIPYMLDLKAMDEEQHKKRQFIRRHTIVQNIMKHSVIHRDERGNIIYTYKNTAHAAYMLNTTANIIQKICRGIKHNDYYLLSYGEKSLQPVNEKYPEYTVQELQRPPRKVLEVDKPRGTKFWR